MRLSELLETYSGHIGVYNNGHFVGNYTANDLIVTANYGTYVVTNITPSEVMTMDGKEFKLNIDIMAPRKHDMIERLGKIKTYNMSEDDVATINDAIKYIKEH
jgi:hypothetical protein